MECLSIPGGTTDSVTSKLEIYDITKFDNLIIIVGGNDSSDKTDLESFHDKYNNLIKSVKLKNPKCKLFLCMFCPRGDTDVTNIMISFFSCVRRTILPVLTIILISTLRKRKMNGNITFTNPETLSLVVLESSLPQY